MHALKQLNLRRIFVITFLLAQIMIYLILWIQMITDHQLRTGMDFITMYTAGKIAQADGIRQVYDVDLQHAVLEKVVGFDLMPKQILLYIHLPLTIPIFQVIATQTYTTSFTIWAVLLVALFALSVFIFVRSLAWPTKASMLSYITAITFYPIFASILNGQDTAIALLGLALCFYAFIHQKDFLAGLGLALATIVRPHIALILAIPFIFQRRRVFAGYITGTIFLAITTILMLGVEGVFEFVEYMLNSVGGDWYGTNEDAMFNFLGILVRLFPEHIAASRIAAWIGYIAVPIILSVWWARSRTITVTHLGIAVTIAVPAITHLHFHDLTLLLLPIFSLMLVVVDRLEWQPQDAALLPLVYSFILLIGFTPALRFITPYLVILSLILWLWKPGKIFDWVTQHAYNKKAIDN
jgi:hypothetical protein